MDESTGEKRYTMAEAVAELVRRQCAEGRHTPTRHEATLADPVGFYLCDCGKVRWEAVS